MFNQFISGFFYYCCCYFLYEVYSTTYFSIIFKKLNISLLDASHCVSRVVCLSKLCCSAHFYKNIGKIYSRRMRMIS